MVVPLASPHQKTLFPPRGAFGFLKRTTHPERPKTRARTRFSPSSNQAVTVISSCELVGCAKHPKHVSNSANARYSQSLACPSNDQLCSGRKAAVCQYIEAIVRNRRTFSRTISQLMISASLLPRIGEKYAEEKIFDSLRVFALLANGFRTVAGLRS